MQPGIHDRLKSERVQSPFREALERLPEWEVTAERPVLRYTARVDGPELAEDLLRMALDVGHEHGSTPRVTIEDGEVRIELPTAEGGIASRELQLAEALSRALPHVVGDGR